MNQLMVFARNDDSAQEIMNFGIDHFESLLGIKSPVNMIPLKCQLHHIADKPEIRLEGNNVIISETFNGSVIIGSPWELTNPRFIGFTISKPFYIGNSREYLKEFNALSELNLESAKLKGTQDHLYFVQAMRHFINNIKCRDN